MYCVSIDDDSFLIPLQLKLVHQTTLQPPAVECSPFQVLVSAASHQKNVRTRTSHSICTLGKCSYGNRIFSTPKLKFGLIARATESEPHQLNVGSPETIKQAVFAKDRPLIILIHGYTGHKDFSPNTEIRPGKILIHCRIALNLFLFPQKRT